MTKLPENSRMKTVAVHGGESPDPVTRASTPNLVMSSTFIADPDAAFSVEGMSEDTPFFYTRWSNPTVDQLERKLALLENGEAGLAFASGMAAISALFFHLLKPGDHLVISDVAYAAASELTNDLFPGMGVRVSKVNMADLDEVRAAVTADTRLVYAETPANPIMRLTDIEAVAKIAKSAGALMAVDSTFATPVATRPLDLGADIVVHSLTKYLGGHGDALGGALIGAGDILMPLRQKVAVRTGGVLSPFNAWLIMRGLATLPIRMEAHQRTAAAAAAVLEAHPKIRRVVYPGLASHPQHELAQRQMKNSSGMMSFQVEDGPAAARVLADRLNIIHYAVSLGHHRSLLFYIPTADMLESSFRLTAAQERSYREYAGDGVFRFSVGIEDPEDICADLEQALGHL
ncbi:MAG: PLP-dependent aspartate aminotransferase family protein [Gammaproteobacteria bacterium]|nr:PLP-dependent aspartate aminotransferase family protein [Gammaproteobacteria bacterium]